MQPLILITNDDGIKSPAIEKLIDIFRKEYRIVVAAPKYPQSAKGCSHAHGDTWVSVEKRTINGIDWISVDNSPATSVSVALRYYNIKPDLVISGINHGENLGLNLFYSGTIGAAWEAAMSGFLSLAVSLELPANKHFTMDKDVDFTVSAYFTKAIAEKLLSDNPKCLLWNVNIPTSATRETKIVETSIAKERWNYPIIREKREDNSPIELRFEYEPTGHQFDADTDINVIRSGIVSLVKIDQFMFPWF